MSPDRPRFGGVGLDAVRVEHAPGQQSAENRSTGDRPDDLVDFSHGDVDAFPPSPGAFDAVRRAYDVGGDMAYSVYRGHASIRTPLADRLSRFMGTAVDADRELIITPGTETALFLALSSLVEPGDKVVIIEPDYFANRKIVHYLRGEPVSVRLDYRRDGPATLDLDQLTDALQGGARVVCLSNPNNPTGVVYSEGDLQRIVDAVRAVDGFIVIDQLYSRLIYDGVTFTHLRALAGASDICLTLSGPSKTESLSGFRVGTAVGPAWLIDRMERLLSIVTLRTAGYNQSALDAWLTEPAGWIERRVNEHQAIRDDLSARLREVGGMVVRTTEGGSYLFADLPRLSVSTDALVDGARAHARVVVTRGEEFGPRMVTSVRLNFSQDRVRAGSAVDRFSTLVASLRV